VRERIEMDGDGVVQAAGGRMDHIDTAMPRRARGDRHHLAQPGLVAGDRLPPYPVLDDDGDGSGGGRLVLVQRSSDVDGRGSGELGSWRGGGHGWRPGGNDDVITGRSAAPWHRGTGPAVILGRSAVPRCPRRRVRRRSSIRPGRSRAAVRRCASTPRPWSGCRRPAPWLPRTGS